MDVKPQPKKKPQTALNKAVKNINKLIQDGGIKTSTTTKVAKSEPVLATGSTSKNKSVPKIKADGNKNNKKSPRGKVYPDRGVVYLSHIPHGFYEAEMKAFFKQFGHVTRLRLVRSDKTGNSKGYAFVEFRFSEVAQVVAETMNNYLMRNRLLKATYIPPEKQTPKMFVHSTNYGPETCIGVINRRIARKLQNKSLSPSETELRVNRQKEKLIELQEKLKAQGVDCVFQVDGGSSKRLLQASVSTPPPVKRPRLSSPAPKESSTKSAAASKQSLATSVKKQSTSNKGKATQVKTKSVKKSKSLVNSSKKPNLKTAKKQIAEKKAVTKKVTKKSVLTKSGSSKKALSKKSKTKKPATKK